MRSDSGGRVLGGVLDQVEDVVHARDQAVDVVAVERRDEGRVQQRHGLVGDLVGAALHVADALDQGAAPRLVGVVVHQFGHGPAAGDEVFGVAIEQREEPRLARHQGGQEPHWAFLESLGRCGAKYP